VSVPPLEASCLPYFQVDNSNFGISARTILGGNFLGINYDTVEPGQLDSIIEKRKSHMQPVLLKRRVSEHASFCVQTGQ